MSVMLIRVRLGGLGWVSRSWVFMIMFVLFVCSGVRLFWWFLLSW